MERLESPSSSTGAQAEEHTVEVDRQTAHADHPAAGAEQPTADDQGSVATHPAPEDDDAETTRLCVRMRARRFGRRLLGGLKPEEVVAFVDEVAKALYVAQRQNNHLGGRLKSLEDEVRALRSKHGSMAPPDEEKAAAAVSRLEMFRRTTLQEIEALLHEAQAQAQAMSEAARERAARIVQEADARKTLREQEAEALVAEASATAEALLASARDQEAALRREIDRLAESRLRLFDDVRAALTAYGQWLASIDPRRRCSDDRNMASASIANGSP